MYRCIDIMYVMYWYYLIILLYVSEYVASKDWVERLPTAPNPIDKNQNWPWHPKAGYYSEWHNEHYEL